MEHILTSAVLEQTHSAADYLYWVKSLIALTKAEELDGLRKIRLRLGLAKELMEEALPIGHFAANYFESSNQVNIALKVGNQGYDAIVSDLRERQSGLEYLEVTLASEGEADYLRMLVLHLNGQVSSIGRATKSGTRKTDKLVTVKYESVSQADVLAKERRIIAEAVERKLAKNYPANTAPYNWVLMTPCPLIEATTLQTFRAPLPSSANGSPYSTLLPLSAWSRTCS